MRSTLRNTIIASMTAVVVASLFAASRRDVEGRAPAPQRQRPVLTGVIKLSGDPPNIDALNKRLLEQMKLKDADYCRKCDDSEKSQQAYRLGGRDNRQVGNVFVWIAPVAGSFFPINEKQLEEARNREVKLRQPHCAFIPHCLFLFPQYHPDPQNPRHLQPTGQVLKLVNDAEISHNVNYSGGSRSTGHNCLLASKTERIVNNLVPEMKEVSVRCNIHPWMCAYVRVVDTPYYAISLSDTLDGKDKVAKDSPRFGTYEIDNPPPGKVCIRAWHEVGGYLNRNGSKGEALEVKAAGATRKDFELTAR